MPSTASAVSRFRAAVVLLLTLRGTPFLYYGEELGMRDVDVAPNQRHDVWASGGRDGCRTPMLWEQPEQVAADLAAFVDGLSTSGRNSTPIT